MEVNIQYMSDLHLELFPGFRIPKECIHSDYLVLAGDIGDPSSNEYEEFLNDVECKFEKVFVVLGNHEFYNKSIKQTQRITQDLIDLFQNKVIFLNKSSYDIIPGKLKIIGTTLWSHVEGPNAYEIRSCISDYRKISDMKSICQNNELHEKDLRWLKAEISMITDDTKVIVVTHHAPSFNKTSNPIHQYSSLQSAFASDLDDMIKPPIVAWIYGHTHYSNTQILKNGIILASNQRGYADESDDNFDIGKILTFKI